MNLPNRLTILRIILAFVFMFLLFTRGLEAKIMAFLIFTIASITDFYDGYIARKYNLITDLGKLLDPLADKILVIGAFLCFMEMNLIPVWIVMIIILREFLITGMRIVAASQGKVLAAAKSGKHKTVSQIVSIFVILLFIILREVGVSELSFWNDSLEHWYRNIIFLLMLITAGLTITSGVSYFLQNRSHFFNPGD